MADDLDQALRSIEGEGPSPEFVASLRERLMAELAETVESATDIDEPFVVDIDLRPDEREHAMTKTRWILLAAAAAAIALVAGFAILSSDQDDGALETITTPDESTTTAVPTTAVPTTAVPTTAAPTTAAPTTVPTEVPPGTFDANATPLPTQFTSIESGSYRADPSFALPFSFTTDLSLFLQENGTSRIALSSPSSRDPGDLDIRFLSLTNAYFLTGLDVPPDNQGDESLEGFGAWLDTLADGVASGREATMVGRSDAITVELLAEGDGFSKYRIWAVDQGDQSPLAIVAAINDEEDGVWFDVAERIVSTIAFGESAADQ